MEKEYIILQRDCKKDTPIKIKLNQGKDEWDYYRMKANMIDPANVSAVNIGPMTVFEYYEAIDFSSVKFRIINDSNDIKVHKFNCVDNNTWKGTFKSFIIMTTDYYNKTFGIRYCDNHNECNTNEYCLCPDGHEHPSWCPKSKRRCMNWNNFRSEAPLPLHNDDNIYTQCLEDQIKLFTKDSNHVKYDILKEFSRKCALDKKNIEGFNMINKNYVILFFFLFIIVLIWIV